MDDRRARAEMIEDFAAALRELRDSVGNPPFREMSGRSGAISHTTLHEATKGNRLPSWETTVEFAKACGADPALYRERWERANLAVRSASAGGPSVRADASVDRPAGELAASTAGGAERRNVHIAIGPQTPRSAGETSAPTPPSRPEENTGDVQPILPALGGRGRSRLTRPAAAALAVTAGIGTVVLVVALVNRDSEPNGSKPPLSIATVSPTTCPVVPTNPPSAPPANKGDASLFIGDITLQDCEHVAGGKKITKVWRLQNIGTVPWKGYSLTRLDDSPQQADQCQTIPHVPIRDTRPGKTVDIEVEITTPRKPGFCYVRFKMVDSSGKVLFPGSRPVNFQIFVDG